MKNKVTKYCNKSILNSIYHESKVIYHCLKVQVTVNSNTPCAFDLAFEWTLILEVLGMSEIQVDS